MRAASGRWAGVVPHALSKEKTEEKKENLQRKEKTEGQGTNHLGRRRKDVSKICDDITDVKQRRRKLSRREHK